MSRGPSQVNYEGARFLWRRGHRQAARRGGEGGPAGNQACRAVRAHMQSIHQEAPRSNPNPHPSRSPTLLSPPRRRVCADDVCKVSAAPCFLSCRPFCNLCTNFKPFSRVRSRGLAARPGGLRAGSGRRRRACRWPRQRTERGPTAAGTRGQASGRGACARQALCGKTGAVVAAAAARLLALCRLCSGGGHEHDHAAPCSAAPSTAALSPRSPNPGAHRGRQRARRYNAAGGQGKLTRRLQAGSTRAGPAARHGVRRRGRRRAAARAAAASAARAAPPSRRRRRGRGAWARRPAWP
jgi:hypothetical protein